MTDLHSHAGQSRRGAWAQLAVGAVLLGGFALRLYGLGQPSLSLDELSQASAASAGLWAALQGARNQPGAPALDYVLTWLALLVVHSDFVVRLPAAMLGTLTLALVYRLGRELFGSLTGLLAALLLAVAPLHLRYSQEARSYALFTALTVANTLALVIALRRNDRSTWAAYTLTLIAALYSHYYAVFLVLAQVAAVLAQSLLSAPAERRQYLLRRRNCVLSCAAAGAAFLPWFIYSMAVLDEAAALRPAPLTIDGQPLGVAAFFHGLALGETRQELAAVVWPLGGLAVVGAATGLAQRRRRGEALLLLAPLLICPLLVALALRRVGYPFAAQQVLFLLPFYLLLAALGMTSSAGWLGKAMHNRTWRPRLEAMVVLGLLALLLLPLRSASGNSLVAAARADWRAVVQFVAANAGPDDVVLAPGIPAQYLTFYDSALASRLVTPPSLQAAQSLSSAAPATWVIAAPPVVPFAGRLGPWLRDASHGAVSVSFGADLGVYYWQPGVDAAGLLAQSLRWQPPHNLRALEELVYLYDQADLPAAAASVAAQGAALAANREQASFFEMMRGSIWRDHGDSLAAVAAFQQALGLWPENAEAAVRMGEQLLAMDRKAEAAVVLQRAAALAPDSYWAHRLLGETRQRQGLWAEAIAAYRSASAANPDEPETYFLLGAVLAATGDRAGAIAVYEQFVQRAPDSPLAAEVQQRLRDLRSAP